MFRYFYSSLIQAYREHLTASIGATHSPTDGARPITHKWVKRSINMQVLSPVCGQKPVIPLQADRSPIQTVLV